MTTEETDRAAFIESYRNSFDLSEINDAWGRPMFMHPHIESVWRGWRKGRADLRTRLSAQADVRADVRAATIEECAKIAEEAFADPNWHMLYRMASTVIAERIRALASQEKQP